MTEGTITALRTKFLLWHETGGRAMGGKKKDGRVRYSLKKERRTVAAHH